VIPTEFLEVFTMNTQAHKEVILGVDTHLDKHVGVIIDGFGKYLGNLSIETNTAGYHFNY